MRAIRTVQRHDPMRFQPREEQARHPTVICPTVAEASPEPARYASQHSMTTAKPGTTGSASLLLRHLPRSTEPDRRYESHKRASLP